MKDQQSSSNIGTQKPAEEPNSGSTTSWFNKLSRAFSNQPKDILEVREFLHTAVKEGVLSADVVAMMDGALDVSEAQARDVMIPRSQMMVISQDASNTELLKLVVDSGHSRFPVVGEDKDEIVGILLAKDLLRYVSTPGEEVKLADMLRDAVIIPESKRLNILLRDFRASRNHMAIVVDEYGGVAGLITIEDVLEEIVGEIDDEHDAEEAANISTLGDKTWQVAALTEIDEFNEAFAANFSDEDYGTIGGLLLAEFGRLPETGESVNLDRFKFTVSKSDARRLQQLEVQEV
ncbi:MAG: CBS domain-containing protein [Xanthomonadales bacterium]|nr:CBS domain-containing protein [Xanthomonadales bacterium]